MAMLNDLKKIFFGAKAVTKSAADKAVDAGSEAAENVAENAAELWDKAKDSLGEAGKTIREKAAEAWDKAADMADDVSEKFSGHSEKPDTADIMDEIIADTKARPASPPVATQEAEEETLELPPLVVPPVGQNNLLEAPDGETDFFEEIKNSMASSTETGADESSETFDKAKDFTESVGSRVMETGGKAAEKVGETAEKVGGVVLEKSDEALDKAKDLAESVGSKVLETGGRFADKFGETAEDVGSAIFEKAGEASERLKGFAADLGSKISSAKDDLMKKAEEEAAKSGDTADSLADKARELNQKLEDKISGNNTRFADKPIDTGGSELNKHGSFWDKAERFAQGDYHDKGAQPQRKPGELSIGTDPDFQQKDKGKLKGFEDLDGDGDDLIDDAIVES